MPTADPVNGRFVYDENATSRVSSVLTGQVIGLSAGVGDGVSRGQSLLEIDSPERALQLHEHEVIARKELEFAEADYQQASADARRTAAKSAGVGPPE